MKKTCLLVGLAVAIGFWIGMPLSIGQNKGGTGRLSQKDRVLRSLKDFRKLSEGMTQEQFENVRSIEQLYALLYADDPKFTMMAGGGSAWHYVDEHAGTKYSYLVYPYSRGRKLTDSIYIATPCSIDGVRLVLNHALKIEEVNESTFHFRVYSQSK
ncbi:hypothetical protein DES53_10937 [Roseimicrobium gellanilyticum]|uniref:Uncharacterized protein n=1 Tax=Roseimicrobium gellanilyticum TaxID=748857 RepID=A0A366HCB1_9BACT|nr:hypothetical protein [Roseimicrobium gellanilyticum]RBP39610.1 hypothetical protein DES53_10937 [Roseimicrobium gellanilyticum]